MGTSTVHRSPSTSRWAIVNSLYEDSAVSADRILDEVLNAAAEYPVGLAGPAVLTRVEAVLRVAEEGTWRGGLDAALATSRVAVQQARQASLDAGTVSFFGDLADKALHVTVTAGAREPIGLASSTAALTAFLGNLVVAAVDHLVSRDLSSHLGRGRISGASEALALRRSILLRARDLAAAERLVPSVRLAAASPREQWSETIAAVWSPDTPAPTVPGERIRP